MQHEEPVNWVEKPPHVLCGVTNLPFDWLLDQVLAWVALVHGTHTRVQNIAI